MQWQWIMLVALMTVLLVVLITDKIVKAADGEYKDQCIEHGIGAFDGQDPVWVQLFTRCIKRCVFKRKPAALQQFLWLSGAWTLQDVLEAEDRVQVVRIRNEVHGTALVFLSAPNSWSHRFHMLRGMRPVRVSEEAEVLGFVYRSADALRGLVGTWSDVDLVFGLCAGGAVALTLMALEIPTGTRHPPTYVETSIPFVRGTISGARARGLRNMADPVSWVLSRLKYRFPGQVSRFRRVLPSIATAHSALVSRQRHL